jgi:hypothetical protein
MIRKLKSGQYRLYSRKVDRRTGKRRNLGTFATRAKAEKHEREVQYFKRAHHLCPAPGPSRPRQRNRTAQRNGGRRMTGAGRDGQAR